MLEVGQKAPDFKLLDCENKNVSLGDYRGKWLVLYFYPKDSTPGCTKEACDFSDSLSGFTGLNAEIVGISADSISSHQKFIAKYDLGIKLLSDPDRIVIKEYQAWGEKKLYGKISEGLIRTTYIINPEGEIAGSWKNVRVRVKRKSGEVKHADIVREKLTELQNA